MTKRTETPGQSPRDDNGPITPPQGHVVRVRPEDEAVIWEWMQPHGWPDWQADFFEFTLIRPSCLYWLRARVECGDIIIHPTSPTKL